MLLVTGGAGFLGSNVVAAPRWSARDVMARALSGQLP